MNAADDFPTAPASDPFPSTFPTRRPLSPEEINRDDERVLRLDMKASTGNPRIKFVRTSTNDIMSRTFEPIKWVVPRYLSEGFLVLAGRQKLGKTWLAID